ncbi:PstS family phosphate ABC transporter substrate-binding protein, partial [Rhizobiaceae sp. 2RAB30]
MKNFLLTASAAALALAVSAGYASARDQIQIAGSSTVLPYAKIVAETFGETFTNFKTPVVESGGSGAGIKEFCKGVGENTIDIANSSRKIKEDEVKSCVDAGVKEEGMANKPESESFIDMFAKLGQDLKLPS